MDLPVVAFKLVELVELVCTVAGRMWLRGENVVGRIDGVRRWICSLAAVKVLFVAALKRRKSELSMS